MPEQRAGKINNASKRTVCEKPQFFFVRWYAIISAIYFRKNGGKNNAEYAM